MRDLLSDLEAGGPLDPVERAKVLSRRELPKRFYTQVTQAPGEGGHVVLLDGRPVKTARRAPLVLPTPTLGEKVAAEWAAQESEIDPLTMPLTRIANVAIDAVADKRDEVADDVAAFAGNDLLVYRADGPETLVARQTALWDPVIGWAETRFQGRFRLAEGIMPVTQDAGVIARVRAALDGLPALRLAALHVTTTLTGSALLALALMEGARDADAVWAAAHVDEDWNIEQWGLDAEAERVRTLRRRDLDAAAVILAEA
ncbi:ATP12 family protein [Stappia sp.]|uniref:ATP12 family chaperone protein n=1 Tax=Stappia sp. TaxID=1870903 RepID=UPI0032D8BD81